MLSDVMMFDELKFSLEKWHKGELDVGQNDKAGFYYIRWSRRNMNKETNKPC